MIDIDCFVVFGLRRTGNHAIINWICNQSIPSAHYNNCVHDPFGNIQTSFTKKFYLEDGICDNSNRKLDSFKSVVFNFENQSIKEVTFGLKLLRLNMEKVRYIVIVRDPFNLFASRMRGSNGGGRFVDIWKSHVQACMGNPDIIGINFNKWFSEKIYREKLAKRLGLEFTDEGVDQVFWFGASSFDAKNFDGQAQKMKVLERWKEKPRSPELKEQYTRIVSDPSVRELSKKYFNFLPGG